MLTIDEIKTSKYLLLKNVNVAFARRIVIVEGITPLHSSNYNDDYTLKISGNKQNQFYRLINKKTSKVIWAVDEVGACFLVVKATNNIAELLELEDTIVFNLGVGQEYTKAHCYLHQPKYKRFLFEILNEKHSLSTLFKMYGGDSKIVRVITRDEDFYNHTKNIKPTGGIDSA